MRGVMKKQRYFLFLKKNYFLLIFIKIILFSSNIKIITTNNNRYIFTQLRFSYMLYNTLFFVNTIFFTNASIFNKNIFFFTKNNSLGDCFSFFFKKNFKKKGISFKKTIFNALQTQKLSNDNDLKLSSNWVNVYRDYFYISSINHKRRIIRRALLKKKTTTVGYTKHPNNWSVLKQFYECSDWTHTLTPPMFTTMLFLSIYSIFLQKKTIFLQKKTIFLQIFKKNCFFWLNSFKFFRYFFSFFFFFFFQRQKTIIFIYFFENKQLYFNSFFKKKQFLKILKNKNYNNVFFFKKLFYVYVYTLNFCSKFFLSWNSLYSLKKKTEYMNILSYPTHKQFFFFLKILKNLYTSKDKNKFFFFNKLHCIFRKTRIYKNIWSQHTRHPFKYKTISPLKISQQFDKKILFFYKKFRFFFFKKFLSLPGFFKGNNYITNINFYAYLLFVPDSFFKNYVLGDKVHKLHIKYTNLLPIFFKKSRETGEAQLIRQQSNLYSLYTWYILNIAELKFKKKVFIKVCNIRRFFLKIKFNKLFSNFKLVYRSYKYKIKKNFSLKQIFQIIILVLCFKDTTLFMNWFTLTLTNLKYRFVKTFLYFLKSSLINFFLPKIGTPNGVLGFFFDIRGKVGVTGDAKKRHTQISWGNPGYTTKNSRFSFKQGLVYTHTGVMGVTVALTY